MTISTPNLPTKGSGLPDKIKTTVGGSVSSNVNVIAKMSIIAPVLKNKTDELVATTGDLNKVGAAIGEAIGAHNIKEVGDNWAEASTDWDKAVVDRITREVMKKNPQKYPANRPLTEQEKKDLAAEVETERQKFDADMRSQIGENWFELGSAVKNGGAEATQAIAEYISIKDIFSTPTSTGNLDDLCKKIERTVQTTIDATQKMASAGQRVFKWLMHNDIGHGHSESVILNNIKNIGISRFGMGATAIAGTAVGINAMVSAFKTGGITGAISAGQSAYNTVRANWDKAENARTTFFANKEEIAEASALGRHPFWDCKHHPDPRYVGDFPEDPYTSTGLDGGTVTGCAAPITSEDAARLMSDDSECSKEEGNEGNNTSNRGDAEFVSEINFILDGNKTDGNSECVVGGTEYLLSDYQLSQSMLSPMTLSFSMVKKVVAEEDEKDVKYEVCKQIIGLDVEMTVKTKYSDAPGTAASEFSFKGLITGVSSSRGMGGTPSIFVTASSYDYLLNGAPNCRSFENKTLEEIVSAVTGSVTKLKTKISPRLKTAIPYIVQYNQTDYDFLASLARRFGEWMYHDGTCFVFGEIVSPSDNVVNMRYPGGNVFSHGIDLQLRDMNIMHVTTDLYNYDNEGIVKQSDEGTADRKTHELNDVAWERVKSLYSRQSVYYPHLGGSFDNGSEEGTKELMLNSIKVESRGKRAQMLICNGSSKVAKLFLGQQFQIEDGVENISTDKGEVNQHPLMVLSVSHSFSLDQSYENTFEALPPSCDYPPYSNADIFATAYPQRATVVDNQDPAGLGRVRVQFPWQKVQDNGDEKMWSPWIRVAQSYGGFSKGAQFISEVGEEVMIGFEMDNIERPYVIGALFNGTSDPDPEWMAKVASGTANNIKAIRTRNGHTIQFSDEGEGGDIQIYDYEKHNYLIHLSTDGKYIRIEAKGDIQIVAGNDITMSAKKNINISAGENISVESGMDTDISADANISVSAQDNMQQQATDLFVKMSDSISQESANSHIIKTTELKEKASGKASIDGGGLVEITAASVKVR